MKRYRMKLMPGFVQASGVVAEITNLMDEHQSGEWCRYEDAREHFEDAKRWRGLQAQEVELAAEMEAGGVNAALEKILNENAEEQRLLRELEEAEQAMYQYGPGGNLGHAQDAVTRLRSAGDALREFRARQKGGAA